MGFKISFHGCSIGEDRNGRDHRTIDQSERVFESIIMESQTCRR